MLDYTKVKKKNLAVKLFDGTVLSLTTPKKRVFEKMASIKFESADELSPETISEIYEITAEILSSNVQKKNYTTETVGEIFDLDDVILLFNEYMTFASEITTDPN